MVDLTGVLLGLRWGVVYVDTWERHESVMFVPDGVNGETMVGGNGVLVGDVGRNLV